MDTDDLEPHKTMPKRPDLSVMSVEQLKNYISDMEVEITRVQAAISEKQAAREVADDVFKA